MKKARMNKISLGISLSFLLLVIGLVTGYLLTDNRTSNTAASTIEISTPQVLSQDPTLLAYAKDFGATEVNDVSIQFTSTLGDDGRVGEYNAPYAGDNMFDGSKPNKTNAKIEVVTGRSVDDTKRTLAHEYLHHIWFTRLSEDEKVMLGSDLKTIYGNDQYMKNRVASYSDRFQLQDTELFSFYCTESSDSYLTTLIISQCNKYITRNALVMYR